MGEHRRLRRVSVAMAVTLLVLAAAASAAEPERRSGIIVDIAADGTSFVLSEVGPWRAEQPTAAITKRTIALTPDTRYAVVRRADDAPSGFGHDFVEIPARPEDIYMNDFVTVDVRREGQRLVALKVTAIMLPAAGSRGAGGR